MSNSCQFQDLSSGRMIGSARIRGGLYFFERQIKESSLGSNSISGSSFVSNSVLHSKTIMLWHCRLGHPSFLYLKYLFPSLFVNTNVTDFKCDICQVAKHTRALFPHKIYTPSNAFSLIHSDIWGPSKVNTSHGKR